MKIKKEEFFWFLPFIFFLLGYYVFYFFLNKKVIINPPVIGKSIQEATNILSAKGLGLRLLKELEDPDLPEGTILNQIPTANQNIKPNQHVFVIVSKKPTIEKAPNFLGDLKNDINIKTERMGLSIESFFQDSFFPKNSCIAQNPSPNYDLKNNKMILYFSAGKENFYIVPNLKGSLIEDLRDLFDKDQIVIEAFYDNERVEIDNLINYKVIDQKPIPGSIVDLSKKLYLQLLLI